MICDNFGGIRDPLKQNVALQFCRNRNKDVSILTETHINLDQIHHIRNNWLGAIFFSPGDSHKKRIACPASSAALQIRVGQRSITASVWPLTTHIYQVMIIMAGGFSRKSFYYYFYFEEILFNDHELVFLKIVNIQNSFLFHARE